MTARITISIKNSKAQVMAQRHWKISECTGQYGDISKGEGIRDKWMDLVSDHTCN